MSTIYNKNYILIIFFFFFFFNDTATTEIYTLSLHDALPISDRLGARLRQSQRAHLALLDEALHRAHRFLDWHVGVDPVLVIKIDDVDAQALEARVAGLHDIFGPAVDALLAVGALGLAELGGDDRLVG